MMRVGITGHQEREGIQWPWVRHTVRVELNKLKDVRGTFSSLAMGSDQLFAEVAIDLGLPVTAVLPLEGYERFFREGGLLNYRRLLGQCERMQLRWKGDPKRAFFEAGKYIVNQCDYLFAVWDGAPADGLGGTGDVVDYAQRKHRPTIHINPITEVVSRIRC
jgi:hypothetical protein